MTHEQMFRDTALSVSVFGLNSSVLRTVCADQMQGGPDHFIGSGMGKLFADGVGVWKERELPSAESWHHACHALSVYFPFLI